MKKIVILIALLVVFVHLDTVVLADAEWGKDQEDGIVKCYYIESANFDAFYNMVKTSKGSPHDIAVNEAEYSIRNSYEGEGIKIVSYIADRLLPHPRYVYESEEYGWENWIIYGKVIGIMSPETVKRFGYKSSIKNIFFQNNIKCDVNDYMILRVSNDIPPVIWVDTNLGYYYITFENDYSESISTIDYSRNNNFIFKIYDAKSFEKVLTYQDAQIMVDNEKIINENYYSKIRGNIAHVSLRTALEALGSTVMWDDKSNSVIFTCNNDTYAFNTSDNFDVHKRVMVSRDGGGYEPVFWSDRVAFEMIDERIVVDNETLQYFTKLFGKSVTVNLDALVVSINRVNEEQKIEVAMGSNGVVNESNEKVSETESSALTLDDFIFVTKNMDMDTIYQRVGEPSYYTGYGFMWGVYELSDGNKLHLNDHLTGKLNTVRLETPNGELIPIDFNEDGTMKIL